MKHEAYLLLGGNMGDRQRYLKEGMEAIEERCGQLIGHSPLYETAAWGKENQQAFLNRAIHLKTDLSPNALLQEIALIEHQFGRQREEVWGERTLDIDILFYDDAGLNTPTLTIPHPQLQNRRFVLEPMVALAPALSHPIFGKTMATMLAECPDLLPVTALPD